MIYLIQTDTCYGLACSINDTGSYKKIYEIKKRDFSKPLSIMVYDLSWLKKFSNLNNYQIDFLKKYNKAFSIMTGSNYLKMFINHKEKDLSIFPNAKYYQDFVFRVANFNFQKSLIKKIGPIFLTSANLSGDQEIYDYEILLKHFSKYIKSGEIIFIGNKKNLQKVAPSEIFGFIGESLNKKIIRN